jgi:signal peptidase I
VAAGKYTPQPGDIIYFRSDRNENPTNHVGIVTKYSGGTVYTIEGNTSSATISTNGGAVCTKSYSISNTYIVYICKPNYSGEDPLKSVVFDATYYGNSYSDVKSAYGTDAVKLYQHFLTTGIKEGRKASPVFDVKYYVRNNSELYSIFGDDHEAAFSHFIDYGQHESSRVYSKELTEVRDAIFDPKFYAAQYPSVYETYGDDVGGCSPTS